MVRSMSVAFLSISATIFSLSYSANPHPTHNEQDIISRPIAVYIAAMKGECLPEGRLFLIVNGQVRILPPASQQHAEATAERNFLNRFDDEPGLRHVMEEEFKKHHTVHVVNSLDQADVVFYTCSQYHGLRSDPDVRQQSAFSEKVLIYTQASAVSPAVYSKSRNDPRALRAGAYWNSDTLETDGKEKTDDARKKNNNPPSSGILINGQQFDPGEEEIPLYALAARFAKLPLPMLEQIRQASKAGKIGEAAVATKESASASKPAMKSPITTSDAEAKSNSPRLVVPVIAMDKAGKYIPDLRRADFELFEDQVKQELSGFGAEQDAFHIALILNLSWSARERLKEIQEAAKSFLKQLSPQDRVMVISFNGRIRVNAEFTDDRETLFRAISDINAGGEMRVTDALDLTLTERLNRIPGRKALVLFTDGVERSSWLADWEDVLERAEESETLFYPVQYDILGDLSLLRSGDRSGAANVGLAKSGKLDEGSERTAQGLKQLAEKSGGRYYNVRTIEETNRAFAGIAGELRRYYWLGYSPADASRTSRYRKIQVRVNRPDATVRTREGYRTAGKNSDRR